MGPLQNRRILLVEDQIIIAVALRDALVALGNEVLGPAGTLEHALELARVAEIDAAVLDIGLRGKLAYPVGDILAQRGIPFVITSGITMTDEPESCRHVPRLMKPFTHDELYAALSTL